MLFIPWVVPPASNSHHQDYSIFNRESQPKPLFVTITGRGDNPIYTGWYDVCSDWAPRIGAKGLSSFVIGHGVGCRCSEIPARMAMFVCHINYPSLPKSSSYTFWGGVKGAPKGLLRRCLGVQTPSHKVFGRLGLVSKRSNHALRR